MFVLTLSYLHDPIIRTCLSEPIHVENKGNWVVHGEMEKFYTLPRELGHRGIISIALPMDGGLANPMLRRTRQRHDEWYVAIKDAKEREKLKSREWIIGGLCALHVGANAFRHSTNRFLPSGTRMKLSHLWGVVEGLREAAQKLAEKAWDLVMAVEWVDQPECGQAVKEWWLLLGFPFTLCESLAELNLIVREGGVLTANRMMQHEDGVHKRMHDSLVAVMRFRRAKEMRFAAIGGTSQYLVALGTLGLDTMVAKYINDDKITDHALNGYKNLDTELRHFLAVGAASCCVSSTFIYETMEDDRLLKRIPEVKDCIMSELQFVKTLGSLTWNRLAKFVGGDMSPAEIQSDATWSIYNQWAYIKEGFFDPVDEFPLKLCQGNIENNLRGLRDSPLPDEAVASRVATCVKRSDPMIELVEGIEEWLEVSCSAKVIEEDHAGGNCVRKEHHGFGKLMQKIRSVCRNILPLIREPKVDSYEARLERQLAAAKRRKPQRATIRGEFLSHVVRASHFLNAGRTPAEKNLAQQTAIKSSNSLWRGLSDPVLNAYSQRRSDRVKRNLDDQEATIQGLEAQIATHKRQRLEDEAGKAKLLRVTNARWSSADIHTVESNFSDYATYSDKYIKDMRKEYNKSGEAPSFERMRALAMLRQQALTYMRPPCPEWLHKVCDNRDEFWQTVFRVRSHPPFLPRFYYCLEACQNPRKVAFLKLVPFVVPGIRWAAVGDARARRVVHQHYFKLTNTVVREANIKRREGDAIDILPQCYIDGNFAFSDLAYIGWDAYMEDLPDARPRNHNDLRTSEDDDWLVRDVAEHRKYGWLKRLQDRARGVGGGHEDGGCKFPHHLPPIDLDEDEMNALRDKIDGFTEEMVRHADLDVKMVPDFHVEKPRAGECTVKVSKRAVDGVRGTYANQSARKFLKKFGMQESFTLGIPRFDLPDAQLLAEEWCRRMQHLKNYWEAAGEANLPFDDGMFEEFVEHPKIKEREAEERGLASAFEGRLRALREIQPQAPEIAD